MFPGDEVGAISRWTAVEMCADEFAALLSQRETAPSFQQRVRAWIVAAFGETVADDHEERNHRFLEEALELVQALGCTQDAANQLVDYVFTRPAGTPEQEAGGAQTTLAALCSANGLDLVAVRETELARMWERIETIRAKQAAKPKYSPLPESRETAPSPNRNIQHLQARADWYADGCDGLEDVEGYKREGLMQDAATDLQNALDLLVRGGAASIREIIASPDPADLVERPERPDEHRPSGASPPAIPPDDGGR
jgi:hypothetical protein